MQDFDYYRPRTVAELKEKLGHPGARALAGGTDLIPKMRRGTLALEALVDLTALTDLAFIEDQGDRVVIGALTTHQAIADSALIRSLNPALRDAAESIGCTQTRCRGTLGGNIANASPAADSLPPLLLYDAEVLVQSLEGERIIPLESFLLDRGETDLQPGEFIHSVSFSPFQGAWGAKFLKIGKRSGMAISVVNTAAALRLDPKGNIDDARVAMGAVGPVVIRCRETEDYLKGKAPDPQVFIEAGERVREEIRPIGDIRSTEAYRLHAAGVIVSRALEAAAAQAGGRGA